MTKALLAVTIDDLQKSGDKAGVCRASIGLLKRMEILSVGDEPAMECNGRVAGGRGAAGG